ncbi:hypothetical protein, partial [Burkholderia territorii]|uniref:hypothetical protein n=1 Tax=Burkholderia territorii TaxID=1503055 RepID=UPI001BAB7F7D
MTAAREMPRAAGWIIGRFVGSGHFNISPEHALEVAPGGARGPWQAVWRADGRARGRPSSASTNAAITRHSSEGTCAAGTAAPSGATRRATASATHRRQGRSERIHPRGSRLLAVKHCNDEDHRPILARRAPVAGCIAALPGRAGRLA